MAMVVMSEAGLWRIGEKPPFRKEMEAEPRGRAKEPGPCWQQRDGWDLPTTEKKTQGLETS